jgi:hypothetical protein
MAAVSLAIIGKHNEPLYLREFGHDANSLDEAELFGLSSSSSSSNNASSISLRQEFILHAALDRFEQLNGPPPGFAWRQQQQQQQQQPQQSPTNPSTTTTTTTTRPPQSDPQFVGLLGPCEDLNLYAWMTTTHIKFLVAVQDAELDGDVVGLLRRLHRVYVEYRLNPMIALTEGPIQSKRFDAQVQQTIEAFNQSIM